MIIGRCIAQALRSDRRKILELLAQLERDDAARRDWIFFAVARVAARTGLADLGLENAKITDFKPSRVADRFFEAVDNMIHDLQRVRIVELQMLRQALNYVDLDHFSNPWDENVQAVGKLRSKAFFRQHVKIILSDDPTMYRVLPRRLQEFFRRSGVINMCVQGADEQKKLHVGADACNYPRVKQERFFICLYQKCLIQPNVPIALVLVLPLGEDLTIRFLHSCVKTCRKRSTRNPWPSLSGS